MRIIYFCVFCSGFSSLQIRKRLPIWAISLGSIPLPCSWCILYWLLSPYMLEPLLLMIYLASFYSSALYSFYRTSRAALKTSWFLWRINALILAVPSACSIRSLTVSTNRFYSLPCSSSCKRAHKVWRINLMRPTSWPRARAAQRGSIKADWCFRKIWLRVNRLTVVSALHMT